MKELNRKVFITIFSIFTLFILLAILIFNVIYYSREYESVKRNLNILETKKEEKEKPIFREMMIIDYEVYTVEIDDFEIDKIISHNSNTNYINIEKIASEIIKNNNTNTIKIGNLYLGKYAYNYRFNNSITILNIETISSRLKILLYESLLILLGLEVLVYFISIKITEWIITPAIESFNKQKDFIADASHELKTPLSVIMASADELTIDKKNKKYIENIKYETERMSYLIKNMLDLSKLENSTNEENKKIENISKIVEKTCITFDAVAYENEVEINTNIKENIKFKCIKEEIERLIGIIIDNAIKHSYKKSIIKIDMYEEKNNIIISITNKGDPIEKSQEEKIFERFYRSDKSRNRNSNRYGLGLAIAKNIVTNHNGTIKASSKDNLTTFKINLKK